MTTGRGVFGISQKLGDAGAQQVAIDGGHAVHPPMLGMSLDELVDFLAPVPSDAEQIVGKAADLLVQVFALVPEGTAHVVAVLLSHVELEQHLQRQFA